MMDSASWIDAKRAAVAAAAFGASWLVARALRPPADNDLALIPRPKDEVPVLGSLKRIVELEFHNFLEKVHEEIGAVVHFNMGGIHVVCVNDPEIVREVLQDNDNFAPSERLIWQYFVPVARGLITLAGDQWRVERKAMSPAFHPERIVSMQGILVECTRRALDKWAADGEVSFTQEMQKLTLDVVCIAALGRDVGAIRGDTDFPDLVHDILTEIDTRSKQLIQWWRLLPTPGARRFRDRVRRLHAHADRLLEERLAMPEQRPDMLGAMIAAYRAGHLTREGLRHEAITIMIGGEDTTSATLSFCVQLLASHPELQERCRKEVKEAVKGAAPSLEELDRMPFLTAFVRETLRLYPPGFMITRQTSGKGAKVGDFRLPPGLSVWLSMYAMFRDKRHWGEDAGEFRPERFLPGGGGEDCRAYMPFSTGVRSCPGRHLAMAESRLVLAMLLRRFAVEFPPGAPGPRLPPSRVIFVLRPALPAHLRLRPL